MSNLIRRASRSVRIRAASRIEDAADAVRETPLPQWFAQAWNDIQFRKYGSLGSKIDAMVAERSLTLVMGLEHSVTRSQGTEESESNG